jgi:transposase
LNPASTRRKSKRKRRSLSRRKRLTKREHAGRNALPAHLPRREEIITVEGEERLCVCCGEERCRIGYEEKEVLDMEPARYFVCA